MLMNRRTMLSLMAVSGLAAAVRRVDRATAAMLTDATEGLRTFSGFRGPNLENWHVELGDAIYTPDDISLSDIRTDHIWPESHEQPYSLLLA
ncbi:MAG: hypothetical protein KC547_23165, partial [Anaerolineae bacterium]|nr:hypothetical protein [Anaerolineae bacterium]